MTATIAFEKQTKALIDDLKSVCANYGLGNDGNEFKIITQVFLYKFLNDKFINEVKQLDDNVAKAANWEEVLNGYGEDDYEMLMMQMSESTARLQPEQFISSLFKRQNEPNFSELFDNTLLAIARDNSDIFSVLTDGGEKIVLFENISKYVTDKRDEFCKALVNKLVNFSFEHIFHEKFDFYATIFEYLIKDYNTNSGGKYAEYFTPHAVAKIMAKCLVQGDVSNATCYDPSAGSGTLLMNLAHEIGEDKCTIYSQDISQKSSNLLRLNLILNDLVHSIPNIVKGNTILDPYHKDDNGNLEQFDYIVSNPPFKLDFSDYRDELDSKENKDRFFAGIPKEPAKKKDSMAIYLLFLQHIMYSLKDNGKAAMVVPTGFLTSGTGIAKNIKKKIIDEKMIRGVISMPANIFANTPTSVSIIFLESNYQKSPILIDASKMGETIKEGKNQKTLLTTNEEDLIIKCFNDTVIIDQFSSSPCHEDIKKKKYSLNPGQYFSVKIDVVDITQDQFKNQLENHLKEINSISKKSLALSESLACQLKKLHYEC